MFTFNFFIPQWFGTTCSWRTLRLFAAGYFSLQPIHPMELLLLLHSESLNAKSFAADGFWSSPGSRRRDASIELS
jgi:hypothetical protein